MNERAVVDRVLKIIEQTPTHDLITDKQYRAYRFKKEIMSRIERYRTCLDGAQEHAASTAASAAQKGI